MAKQDSMPADIWLKANSVKTSPIMISTDEPAISHIQTSLVGLGAFARDVNAQANEALQDSFPELMRAVFTRLKAQMSERGEEGEQFQKMVGQRGKEANRLLDIRRTAEQLMQVGMNKTIYLGSK